MAMMRRLVLALSFLLTGECAAEAVAEAEPLRVPYVSLSPTAGPLWIDVAEG